MVSSTQATNGSQNGNGVVNQSDAAIWNKVHKSLMNIGIPQTPILIRRAKGVMLYVIGLRGNSPNIEILC